MKGLLEGEDCVLCYGAIDDEKGWVVWVMFLWLQRRLGPLLGVVGGRGISNLGREGSSDGKVLCHLVEEPGLDVG